MNEILSPFAQIKYRGNWDTPARAKVRGLYNSGHRQIDIHRMTGIPQPTVSRILNEESSRCTRRGRQYKLYKISKCEVQRIIRYLSKCFTTRSQSHA